VQTTTGEEIHIEVKTTSGPLTTPFFMSAAEVEYARTWPTRYRIYRVYTYSAEAQEIKLHVIEKPLETLDFTPAIFRAAELGEPEVLHDCAATLSVARQSHSRPGLSKSLPTITLLTDCFVSNAGGRSEPSTKTWFWKNGITGEMAILRQLAWRYL
jgi:hypothetical protein